MRITIKFQIKKVICLNVAIGSVALEKQQIAGCNFLALLLKEELTETKVQYLKFTMAFSVQVFF